MSLLIGICQYKNSYRWDLNCKHALKTIASFKKKNADLVCFQEAYLSGYGIESLTLDYTEFDFYLGQIKEHAYLHDICVLMPSIIIKQFKAYNVVYIFNHDGKDSCIYKQGLTRSERIVMNTRRSKHSFYLKGYKIGVIICREIEDLPKKYFQESKNIDLLLWPSYWGWKYKHTWSKIRHDGKTNKAYRFVSKMKKPLIQINMACTRHVNGELLKTGKSVIVNAQNKKVGNGAYGKKDRYLIYYDRNQIKKL